MTLKAWVVDSGEWIAIVYATTAGKAKWLVADAYCSFGDMTESFLGFHCRRAPTMDQFAVVAGVDEDWDQWRAGGFDPDGECR